MKQILGLAVAIGVTSIGFLALAIGPAFAEGGAETSQSAVVVVD